MRVDEGRQHQRPVEVDDGVHDLGMALGALVVTDPPDPAVDDHEGGRVRPVRSADPPASVERRRHGATLGAGGCESVAGQALLRGSAPIRSGSGTARVRGGWSAAVVVLVVVVQSPMPLNVALGAVPACAAHRAVASLTPPDGEVASGPCRALRRLGGSLFGPRARSSTPPRPLRHRGFQSATLALWSGPTRPARHRGSTSAARARWSGLKRRDASPLIAVVGSGAPSGLGATAALLVVVGCPSRPGVSARRWSAGRSGCPSPAAAVVRRRRVPQRCGHPHHPPRPRRVRAAVPSLASVRSGAGPSASAARRITRVRQPGASLP